MIKSILIFFSILSFLLLTSCGKGELVNSNTSTDVLVSVSSREVIDYNRTEVLVNFTGDINTDFFSPNDRISFYSSSSCTTELGSVLVSDFGSLGVELNISFGNSNIPIHYSSVAKSSCTFLEDYSYGTLNPSDPIFDRVVPATPNRVSTAPGFFGEAFPMSSTVELFDDALCTNSLNSGAADQFRTSGISISVSQNSVTTVYARVTDDLSNSSNCIEMITYEHDNLLSDPPVLVAITPSSPSNQSFTPLIRGTVEVDATDVFLYSDSGCTNEIARGTPAEFINPGIQINANENGLIEIYGQSINTSARPSACTRLSDFVHDSISPVAPSFLSITPISPNNQSTNPSIVGASSSDTESIEFYSDVTCINRIGLGTKASFESTGVNAGVSNNTTTTIYARALDLAQNGSNCVEFTTYTHNTIAPPPPTFQSFNPPSPTNITTTPNIGGLVGPRTLVVNVYNDGLCTNLIGTGSNTEFENAAIQITVQPNTNTDVYLTAVDFEGNESGCFSAASYEHSTQTASDPTFVRTIPSSPSNSSTNPLVVGSLDSIIETVGLYSDAGCTNLLESGNRTSFTASGISVNLSANTVNSLYAKAVDKFGNDSNCVFLTNYTHVDVAPLNPTFTSVTPLSPNNITASPTVSGQALQNMASLLPPDEIIFYNSPTCITRIGNGTPLEYTTGIQVSLPENSESVIYGRIFDAAGNRSDCTLITPYVHNNLKPGVPQFTNSIAASPSYVEEIRIFGNYAFSPDFMNRVNLSFFNDSSCTNLITSGDPNLIESTGFNLTVSSNQVTSLYAKSTNEVGTESDCGFMTNFRHSDVAPSGLNVMSRADGTVSINWFPDNVASPQPSYTVERSGAVDGSFSVIASSLPSISFIDSNVEEGETYFYRVYATNNTGRSLYSTPAGISVSAPNAIGVTNLQASSENSQVSLSWSGFPQNTKYQLYRSTQSGGPFVDLIAETNFTSFNDVSVTNDNSYYYIVKGLNPSGLSMQSNIATATPKSGPPKIENFVLTPFRDSRVCNGAPGFRASWNAQSYLTSYTLNRSEVKDQVEVELLNTGQNFATFCNMSVFEDENLYYINATTIWNGGNQLVSDSIGFSNRTSVDLDANAGDNEVILQWTDVTNPTSNQTYYDLYSSSDSDRGFEVLASDLISLSYVDNSVVNGEARFYYVQAKTIDDDGLLVYIGVPSVVVSAGASGVPSNPTNLIVVYEGDTPKELRWSAPSHYNGFAVYRSSNPLGPFTEIDYTTDSVYIFTSEPSGLNYYLIRSIWGSYESSDSNIVSLREASISGLVTVSSASDIQLTWDAVAGVQDYVVYKDTDRNGAFATSFVVSTNNFTDNSVISGEGYYYKLKARFSDTTEGVMSETVSASLSGETLPTSLSLSMSAAGSVKASWAPVNFPALYQVYRSTSLSGPFTQISNTFNSETNIFGLLPLTEYFIRVDYTVGVNTFSSTVESITTLPDIQSPNLEAGDAQVALSWFAVVGATDYNILRSSDGGASFSTIASNFGSNTYVDTSASNDVLYFYKIEANFSGGFTRSSLISSGVTPGVVPLAPQGLIAENNGTGTEIELSWSRGEGVFRYAVYESTTPGVYTTPKFLTSNPYRLIISGLTEGQTYYYSIKAVNGTVESAFSNEVSIVAYRSPESPSVSYSTASEVLISWMVDSQAGTYDLYRSVDNYNYDLLVADLNTNSFLDTTIDNQKTYFYKYMVKTSSGIETSFSDESDPITLSSVPLVPQNLTITSSTSSEVRLEWVSTPSVSVYEVLRSPISGSGYVSLGVVPSTDTFYLDNSVSAGQDYFYVIRSLSITQVPSPYSNEVATSLTSGPSGLTVVDTEGDVDLNWTALSGAGSYEIYRSESLSGPFGLIGVAATNSYTDDSSLPSKEYFYKVYGVLSDDRKTMSSNTESLVVSGFLDFKVAVELLDRPISSSQSSSLSFNRTQTSYNPDDYDGVSQITFSIVASNADTSDRDVILLDSNDLVVGTITIPGSSFNTVSIESASLTMNSSLDIYKLAIEQTTIQNQVNVLSAKINIYQVDATRTKIFYPLLSTDASPTHEDLSGEVISTSDIGYNNFIESVKYLKETSTQSNLFNFNTWELESVVSSTNNAAGSLVLRNTNTSEDVLGSETVIESNDILLAKTYLNEGVTALSSANEGNEYELLLKCNENCDVGEVKVYKSGLWLKVKNLKRLRLYERLTHLKSGVSADETFSAERLNLNSADYFNPVFYHRSVTQDTNSSSVELNLYHHGDSSGNSNLNLQAQSNILADSDDLKLISTSAAFVPVDNDYYMLEVIPMSGTVDLLSSFIMIDVNP